MYRLVAVALLLVACGSPPALTGQQVVDRFVAAGIEVKDVAPQVRPENSPAPNTYKEDLGWTIPSLGDKGGHVLVCDTKKNCDAMVAWYEMFAGLVGPYVYQSPSGTVVVQLNSGLSPDEAARYEAVVAGLP
jgi:hypothetical protein